MFAGMRLYIRACRSPLDGDGTGRLRLPGRCHRIIEGGSIRLSSQDPSSPLNVLCEKDLVLRVFANLIGNGIKFSPRGSSILVAAKELAGQVQFSVADSGPGIPEAHLPHAFD
jgi:signal transduction histidine kinase